MDSEDMTTKMERPGPTPKPWSPVVPAIFVDPNFDLLICRDCCSVFKSMTSHLNDRHSTLTLEERRGLIQKYQRPQNYNYPAIPASTTQPIRAIPYLAIEACHACSKCGQIRGTAESFRKHAGASHPINPHKEPPILSTLVMCQNFNNFNKKWVPVYVDDVVNSFSDTTAISVALSFATNPQEFMDPPPPPPPPPVVDAASLQRPEPPTGISQRKAPVRLPSRAPGRHLKAPITKVVNIQASNVGLANKSSSEAEKQAATSQSRDTSSIQNENTGQNSGP